MIQLFHAAHQGRWVSWTGRQGTYVVSLVQNHKDLLLMKEIRGSGKVVPVIDGVYPLSKAADAFRYYEKEHARGKVVITMEQNN
jgi:NADPH:quinone reductase-like Zn-dependent oxidoreductase